MIEVRGLHKHFGGVHALRDVGLSVPRGACHALMGENGAGKSTLAKVLAGIHRPDAGQVQVDGEVCDFRSPADALARGVAMVHQELSFCPELSVAENLSLGRYPRSVGPFVDRRAMDARAREQLAAIGVELDVRRPMRTLSTAQEQLVQIAAAVGTGARVLLLDEPTSSLSEAESERLFALMARLQEDGVTLVYVSHRIPEVLRLCDRIHVLRDGAYVGSLSREEADEAALVRLMIGRDLQAREPRHLQGEAGEPLLEVQGLSSPEGFRGVDLSVRAGEIVGLAGLVGAGRSALTRAIFGLDGAATGRVRMAGESLPLKGDPHAAIAAGLGLVPEDRKRQGLVLEMGVADNQSLGNLARYRRRGLLDRRQEREQVAAALARLDVRAPSMSAPVSQLSGGNQQKVVLSRWLDRGGRVLMVDEPTRGVDVGAKAAIHDILDELACSGAGVLLVSSELPEVLALSTRVLVMRDGRLVGELTRQAATPDAVMEAMAGVGAHA